MTTDRAMTVGQGMNEESEARLRDPGATGPDSQPTVAAVPRPRSPRTGPSTPGAGRALPSGPEALRWAARELIGDWALFDDDYDNALVAARLEELADQLDNPTEQDT